MQQKHLNNLHSFSIYLSEEGGMLIKSSGSSHALIGEEARSCTEQNIFQKKWKTVGGFIDFGCKRDFFNLFMPLKLESLVLIGCFVINAWRGWLGLISLCLFRLFVWEESVPERSAVQQWWVLHILGLHHLFAFCFHSRQPFTLTCGISGIKQNDIFPDRRVLITFAP